MRTPPITVVLDGDNAALVGKTLQMLARAKPSSDLGVSDRMRRVGDQLYSAARVAGVVR